jgi:multidrug resistance efflux pump
MARVIDANAQPDHQGLLSVNPVFTWVRLARRVPARIHIAQVADGALSRGHQKNRRVRRNDYERQV